MNRGEAQYFRSLDDLVRAAPVVIDRPRGSAHPRYPDAIYPVDYGYLDGTTGGDGHGIDVFVGTATGAGVVAVVLTADVRKRDVETKLLVDCTTDEVAGVGAFLSGALGIGGHVVRWHE